MKSVLLIAAGAAALTLAACDRNGAPLFGPAAEMKPVSRLDCPDRQGPLKRVSASPDGQTCSYSDGDGSEVALQIIKTSGNPQAALRPLEASLSGLAAEPGAAVAAEVKAEAPQAAGPGTREAARLAAAEATKDAGAPGREGEDTDADVERHSGARHGDDDNVTVDLPGLHVKAQGDKADVNVFGMQVHADGDNGSAHVVHKPRSGVGRSFVFDGDDHGGVLRTERMGGANYRATVMWLRSDDTSRQYSSVGYVAAGPKTGPLVVATVRVRGDEKHGIYENAGRIIRRASRS